MSNRKLKFPAQVLAALLIISFLAYDISWANPDALQVQLRLANDDFRVAHEAKCLVEKAEEIAALIDTINPDNLDDILLFRGSAHSAFDGATVEPIYDERDLFVAVDIRIDKGEAILRYAMTGGKLAHELVFSPDLASKLEQNGVRPQTKPQGTQSWERKWGHALSFLLRQGSKIFRVIFGLLGTRSQARPQTRPQPAEERAALFRTIRNVFKEGEGLELTDEEIIAAKVVDTTDDPYRIAKGLPVVIALKGDIFTNIKLDRKPLMIVFCGKGTVTDKNLIFDPRSKGLATEGCNLANSMEVKNAIWEIPYHGKKTTFIAQDKDNWVGMPVLYGPQDIYDAGDLMGKGGDRISRLGPVIGKDAGKPDEDRLFEEYSKAMVVARLLGFAILDGPDMMRDVDNRMGIMVRAVRDTVKDINKAAKRDPRIATIDEREVLKPTTSNPESEGGFSHTKWMVTSSGVVQGTVTALRWLAEVTAHSERFLPAVVGFVRQLGLDINNMSCIIQGFGDVGSGISKLLLTAFLKFTISIRGISNRYFALYNSAGLSKAFLTRAREIAEDNPDGLDIRKLLEMGDDLLKELAGSTLWIANPIDRVTSKRPYDEDAVRELTERFAGLGIAAVFGDETVINEIIYQDATILFPAAGPNLISDPAQIPRLKVKIIAEGANNAILRDLQPELRKAGILYLPGELMNGGGIYTSKEDIRHNQTDGLEAILGDPEYYHVHVTDEIDTLVLHRMMRFLDIWSASEDAFAVDIITHVREAAGAIFQKADDLIRQRDPLLMQLVAIDQERTRGKLPRRHSLYEIAIEMAPQGILYRDAEAGERLAEFEDLSRSIRDIKEDSSLANFDICRIRYVLFVLTKTSEALAPAERARLVNALFKVVADVSIDELVRKEALVCLATLIKWHGVSSEYDVGRAVRLFRGIADSEDKDSRLNVWARYALYRILGVENLDGEATDAFRRFAGVAREELRKVRQDVKRGRYEAIPGSIEKISNTLRMTTSDTALAPLRRFIDDMIHEYARITVLAKSLPANEAVVLEAVDNAEAGLVKLEQIASEGRLIKEADAHRMRLWSMDGLHAQRQLPAKKVLPKGVKVGRVVNKPAWYGRTFVIDLGNGYVTAVKFKKRDERVETLEQEAETMAALRAEGVAAPEPIRNADGSYVAKHAEYISYNPVVWFKLYLAGVDPGYQAISYKAPRGYFDYPEDIKHVPAMKMCAVNSARAIGRLIKSNRFHALLVPLTHDLKNGRPWIWHHDPVGGIRALRKNLSFGNIRVSGMADFAHVQEFMPHHNRRFEIGRMITEWTLAITYNAARNGISKEAIFGIVKEGTAEFAKETGAAFTFTKEMADALELYLTLLGPAVKADNLLSTDDGGKPAVDNLVKFAALVTDMLLSEEGPVAKPAVEQPPQPDVIAKVEAPTRMLLASFILDSRLNYDAQVYEVTSGIVSIGRIHGFDRRDEVLELLGRHLISNILKHTGGGIVTVNRIRRADGVNGIELVGTDHGPGIEDAQKLVEACERGIPGTKDGYWVFANKPDEAVVESRGKRWKKGWNEFVEDGPSDVIDGARVTLALWRRDIYGQSVVEGADESVIPARDVAGDTARIIEAVAGSDTKMVLRDLDVALAGMPEAERLPVLEEVFGRARNLSVKLAIADRILAYEGVAPETIDRIIEVAEKVYPQTGFAAIAAQKAVTYRTGNNPGDIKEYLGAQEGVLRSALDRLWESRRADSLTNEQAANVYPRFEWLRTVLRDDAVKGIRGAFHMITTAIRPEWRALCPAEEYIFDTFKVVEAEDHDAILAVMDAEGIRGAVVVNFDYHEDYTNGAVPEAEWGSVATREGLARANVHVSSPKRLRDAAARKHYLERIRQDEGPLVISICYDYFACKSSSCPENKCACCQEAIRDIVEFIKETGKPVRLAFLANSSRWVAKSPAGTRPNFGLVDYVTWLSERIVEGLAELDSDVQAGSQNSITIELPEPLDVTDHGPDQAGQMPAPDMISVAEPGIGHNQAVHVFSLAYLMHKKLAIATVIEKDGKTADAESQSAVVALGIAEGDRIKVTVKGDCPQERLDAALELWGRFFADSQMLKSQSIANGATNYAREVSGLVKDDKGHVRQGTESEREFVSRIDEFRQNDISMEYNLRIVSLIERFLEKTNVSGQRKIDLRAQLKKFKKGQVKIFGIPSIVKGADDFFFDTFNITAGELFLPAEFLMDLRLRGPPQLADEFLLHAVLCPVIGHYPAIALQQAQYPSHYSKGEYDVEDAGVKYLAGHNGDPTKPFKGLLGERIRETINAVAALEKLVDLTTAVAIMEHGGPWSLVGRMQHILDLLDGIEVHAEDPVGVEASEISNEIVRSIEDYNGITSEVSSMSKRLGDIQDAEHAIEELKQRYEGLIGDIEKAMGRFVDLVGKTPADMLNVSAESKDNIPYLVDQARRKQSNVRVAYFYLNPAPEGLERITLRDWLPAQVWETKVKGIPAANVQVVAVSEAADLRVRAHSGLLHSAIERIVSNGFHVKQREHINEAVDGPIMVQALPAGDGQHAEITVLTWGHIEDSQLDTVSETGVQKIFTLDFNRPEFNHGVGLPFTARSIQKMGGTIKAENIRVDGHDKVKFTITLPLDASSVISGVRPQSDIPALLESSLKYDVSKGGVPTDLVPEGVKIVLSEELFDAESRGRLELILKNNDRVRIVSAKEAHNFAINTTHEKDKTIVILTKKEFDTPSLWSASDKETRITSSILLLEDLLENADYLYLESVLKLACAVMGGRRDAVEAYYKLITGSEISADALDALGVNAVAFAINAILRFDRLSVKDGEVLETYRRVMETFLAAA